MTAGQREPYVVSLTRTARRHLSESVPLDVAIGASDFITGPLADNPHRVGKELDAPLKSVRSARLMQNWRILYVVDEAAHTVIVRAILHRRDAYRPAT
jgi:mRNA-degrading endonuclease RelE of RelBE toxin-antitoxin system